MNRPHSPVLTITVCNNNTTQEDDHARWQTEDSPCFPGPLCVALPPRRPSRQVSVAPPTEECPPELEPTMQPKPRRRFAAERKKLPPQRPIRQPSESHGLGNTLHSLISTSFDSEAIEELSDEELSLSGRLDESMRLDEIDSCLDGSSRDLSPTPPIRQQSMKALRAEIHASVAAIPAEEVAWAQLWESQAGGNGSLADLLKL